MPVSPVISTVPGAAAARRISSFTCCHRRAAPTSASSELVGWICRCSRSTWRASCRRSAADAHAHQQLVAEERLLHEVDRAELHRFDRRVDGAEPGHDDERGVDVHVAQLRSTSRPEMPGIRMSDRMTSKALPFAGAKPSSPLAAVLHGVAGAAQHAAMLSRTPWSSSMRRMRAMHGAKFTIGRSR